MPIDTSMYSQLQAPDVMGGIERGMKMSDMLKTRRDADALKKAYQAGVVTNDDGTTSIDHNKRIQALELANPEKAQEYRRQMQADQNSMLDRKLKEADLIGQVTGGIKDQASYEKALSFLGEQGVDTSKIPKVYDPQLVQAYGNASKSFLEKQYRDRGLDLQEQQLKDNEAHRRQTLGIEYEKLGLERAKAARNPNLTAGEEALDKDFAKDFNEWTSGKSAQARTEIGKLNGVIQGLRDKKVTTGGLTGFFPDRMTADSVLSARADVNSTVMNSLRAILGAQFTEKEGERIIKNTWNEADSTENNVARLERLVGDLYSQADAKDAKAKFFQERGTLAGYQPAQSAQRRENRQNAGATGGAGILAPNSANASPAPKVLKTDEIDWMP